jgi:hypothetical protein
LLITAGHDDDGERPRRRHGGRKQAHRYGRKPKAEHALDEAGEHEHGGDQNQEWLELGHGDTLTHVEFGHNVEVT